MKAVIVFQDINSFGQFIMKDEMLDRFFSEYFFVKKFLYSQDYNNC